MKKERDIIGQILENFTETTGIKVKWKPERSAVVDSSLDGLLQLYLSGKGLSLPVYAKINIHAHHLPGLLATQKHNNDLLVLAQNIPPKIRKELKEAGINYIDAAGNVFIQSKEVFILLEGKKPQPVAENLKAKPFNKAGLKVVFQLLNNDNLINATFREIAAITTVSLDSVHKTIGGLKQGGYLIPLDAKTLKWNNKQELLEKWMVEYDTRLKPSLHIANFRFTKEGDFLEWKHLQLESGVTSWGAEPAGELLTGYLKPETLTIYTSESKTDLIRHYRLVPDPRGYIKVFGKFWDQDNLKENTVPPLLVYTDLVNTGNKRNIETAQKIYEQFLQNKL